MSEQRWDYIGDICVGVVLDCDCEPVPHPDCAEIGCEVVHADQPHESHDLIAPISEDELPEGWTIEKWQAACHLAAAAPGLLAVIESIVALSKKLNEAGIPRTPEGQRLYEQACAVINQAKGIQ